MLRGFDYKCRKCQSWGEVFYDTEVETVLDMVKCECGGMAVRTWKRGPMMVGHGGEFYHPQLGRTFRDRGDMEKYLKKNHLMMAGKDELHRTESMADSGESRLKKEEEAAFDEAIKESYERVIIGKQSVEPAEPIEVGSEDVNVNG